ncbi:MAG TPA: sigma-70 family RNA polymerase sigma factor [Cyclobacteriaceae bacterium]|nr:sigma-70 family RNA polymerase sigma factor [Cyclobacteriaceae bacterium]HRF35298.1 sigma-70 family RNA polymerase sigma factor [Cyclobacteriaceae bacterium]
MRTRYYRRLVYISERITHNREASEEIVHDALLDIWKRTESLAAQDELLIAPYLLTIVKNKSITYYHKSVARPEDNRPIESLDEYVSPGLSVEARILLSDRSKKLYDLVATLPERERACIELKYFQGMSNDAIARELGLSKRTVEKYCTRAIRHLQAQKSAIQ